MLLLALDMVVMSLQEITSDIVRVCLVSGTSGVWISVSIAWQALTCPTDELTH